MNATALIAEDEPLLALALQTELAHAWPDLRIVATVGDGLSAVQHTLALRPQVLFFDIQMPGLNGLEAAADVADGWDNRYPFPALVFVTAYDQYAVQAFEVQAVDYVLKPLQAVRLQKTVSKVQAAIQHTAFNAIDSDTDTEHHLEQTMAQLRHLLTTAQTTSVSPTPPSRLNVIQASVGNHIRMVPVDEVLVFEAADKYVRVLTAQHEYLIRTPLKDLLPQLDGHAFWQIHRGTVVRAEAIEAVARDEAGKQYLSLRGRGEEKWQVSRLYAHLFRAM